VGGNYVGNPSPGSINTNSVFPGIMQVDYVRVYNQTTPLVLSVQQTNSQVMLSWPTNIVCHLQSQSNSLNVGLFNNWADAASATNPFRATPAGSCAFYRLVSP